MSSREALYRLPSLTIAIPSNIVESVNGVDVPCLDYNFSIRDLLAMSTGAVPASEIGQFASRVIANSPLRQISDKHGRSFELLLEMN